jgi:hypothetical protein
MHHYCSKKLKRSGDTFLNLEMKSLFIYLQNLLTNFLPKQIKYKIDSVKDSLGLT